MLHGTDSRPEEVTNTVNATGLHRTLTSAALLGVILKPAIKKEERDQRSHLLVLFSISTCWMFSLSVAIATRSAYLTFSTRKLTVR